jgi:hypothetical protein
VAHIYPCIGILTHDLPALRKSAVEYFPSFWQEIRSPNIHACHDGRPTVMTHSYRPVLGHVSAALALEW